MLILNSFLLSKLFISLYRNRILIYHNRAFFITRNKYILDNSSLEFTYTYINNPREREDLCRHRKPSSRSSSHSGVFQGQSSYLGWCYLHQPKRPCGKKRLSINGEFHFPECSSCSCLVKSRGEPQHRGSRDSRATCQRNRVSFRLTYRNLFKACTSSTLGQIRKSTVWRVGIFACLGKKRRILPFVQRPSLLEPSVDLPGTPASTVDSIYMWVSRVWVIRHWENCDLDWRGTS